MPPCVPRFARSVGSGSCENPHGVPVGTMCTPRSRWSGRAPFGQMFSSVRSICYLVCRRPKATTRSVARHDNQYVSFLIENISRRHTYRAESACFPHGKGPVRRRAEKLRNRHHTRASSSRYANRRGAVHRSSFRLELIPQSFRDMTTLVARDSRREDHNEDSRGVSRSRRARDATCHIAPL